MTADEIVALAETITVIKTGERKVTREETDHDGYPVGEYDTMIPVFTWSFEFNGETVTGVYDEYDGIAFSTAKNALLRKCRDSGVPFATIQRAEHILFPARARFAL